MRSPVLLSSSHDGTTLEFSDRGGEYYSATVRSSSCNASQRVHDYEPSRVVSFFRDLAAQQQGWTGVKKWASIEGQLCLSAASGSKGRTVLQTRLRPPGAHPLDWALEAALLIEAGQMESIAKRMEEFFG